MNYFRCTVGGSGRGNTVVVTCADEFAGQTITLSKTGKTYRKTCPSTAPYVVTFYGVENGTYTVSCIVDGETYSETVIVQDISCVLNYGFKWQTWVDTASQLDSTDYTTLSDVLADEEAVRELFTEHACVDYMASVGASNADLETIIENDLCAKWINNRDYALDFLGANTVIKALMDTAGKYGYGEWVNNNGTWGPKGNVPVMTSNTAPYGEAIGSYASASGNSAAFHAFNGDETENGASMDGADAWIGYSFTNPICVKRVYIHPYPRRMGNYRIEGSNDGSTWTPITEYVTTSDDGSAITANINNEAYYLKLRVHSTTNADNSNMTIREIQFYGHSLSVSVPTMTSNTAPFGTAGASSEKTDSSYYAWKAFDNSSSTKWASATSGSAASGEKLWYHFTNSVKPIMVRIDFEGNSDRQRIQKATLVGSSNGTSWENISDLGAPFSNNTTYVIVTNPNKAYPYIGVKFDTVTDRIVVTTLQFYGKDYSEKEFEEGTTKKWLYDHGVELETATAISLDAIKESNQLYWKNSTSQSSRVSDGFYWTINFTSYSLIRMKLGNWLGSDSERSGQLNVRTGIASGTTEIANINIYKGDSNSPNNYGLDISNVSQEAILLVGDSNSTTHTECGLTATELWLE